jgi:hypothetical protein
VGPRAGIDVMEKEKNPCLCPESNLTHPTCSLVTVLTEVLVEMGKNDDARQGVNRTFRVQLKSSHL